MTPGDWGIVVGLVVAGGLALWYWLTQRAGGVDTAAGRLDDWDDEGGTHVAGWADGEEEEAYEASSRLDDWDEGEETEEEEESGRLDDWDEEE